MELDAKQKLLLAIYAEYQKDLPNMKEAIRPQRLGIEPDVFKVAIQKLLNEGLICDATISQGGNDSVPYMVIVDNAKMTPRGIQYIEQKTSIEVTLSGEQKVKQVAKKAAEWGWEQFKDISVKILAEMAGKTIGL